jgi:hypothetical protein
MSLIALVTWITTAGAGLYLLSVWLIEYDKDFQSVAATRLPPTVLTAHVLLASGGLLIWIAYLIYDQDRLAWTALAAVLLAATLGVTMAIRWFGVYRAGRAANRSQAGQAGALSLVAAADPRNPGPGDRGPITTMARGHDLGPPERNFPLPVVIAHGVFALVTISLVLLTALGAGGG